MLSRLMKFPFYPDKMGTSLKPTHILVKVSIEVKIHLKMPIDLIIIKRLKTPYLVKKTKKVNKQKICCKN